MKKILLPFEGAAYHREMLDFVATLNDRSKVLLTAALLPEVDYANLGNTPVVVGEPVCLPADDETDKKIVYNGARLKRYCEEHDIACRVHEDRFDFAIKALLRETRFADLLLLSSGRFFETVDDHQPNAYMREVLHQAECPVLLLPEKTTLPDEIILAYDGSASSVYAIRQFAYVFPEFSRLRTTLVCIGEGAETDIPEETLIREWGEQHFRNFRALRLRMRTDRFYDTWLGMMQNPWLVSGAFGRSDLSRLFHHSFVNRLISTHQVPLFIAHR